MAKDNTREGIHTGEKRRFLAGMQRIADPYGNNIDRSTGSNDSLQPAAPVTTGVAPIGRR